MYSGGKLEHKSNFLFNIVMNSKSKTVLNGDSKMLRALEYMTVITTLLVSDCLKFEDDDDELQFEQLH